MQVSALMIVFRSFVFKEGQFHISLADVDICLLYEGCFLNLKKGISQTMSMLYPAAAAAAAEGGALRFVDFHLNPH